MSYSVISMPISSSKYSRKCPHSMRPQYITVHNTANDASARSEVSYMRNNSSSTSYHVAVDDKEVVIAAPFNRNCFHSGDGSKGTGENLLVLKFAILDQVVLDSMLLKIMQPDILLHY